MLGSGNSNKESPRFSIVERVFNNGLLVNVLSLLSLILLIEFSFKSSCTFSILDSILSIVLFTSEALESKPKSWSIFSLAPLSLVKLPSLEIGKLVDSFSLFEVSVLN